MSKSYDVTLHIEVHDERELWDAARKSYIDENSGATEDTLADMFGATADEDDIDVSACLRQLFDPGLSPGGTKIHDSTVECFDA